MASPRHADLLLVTGPVSRHMETALRRTYDATPDPKLVVAIGDCGCTGGIFGESYASCGRVSNVIPVDVAVPGCPPTPTAIMQGITANPCIPGASQERGERQALVSVRPVPRAGRICGPGVVIGSRPVRFPKRARMS